MFYIDYEDTDGVIKRKPISGPGRSIEYIEGTQTAKTGSWTGVTKDSSLVTGKTIAYKLPYAGNGNASLNLDFTNPIGSTTQSGAIDVYTNTSRVTTHYGAGSVILLTYDGTNWRASDYWNSNSRDPGYGKITPGTASDAVTAITPNTTQIVATTYNEAMIIEPGNKWIQLAGTNGEAGTDTITIGHAISGVTAANYGDSANQTPSYDETFKVPYLSIDAGGHITSASEHTVKIPTTAGYANVATKLSTTGTTGQFWRGDNSWSNTLTDKLKVSNGIYSHATTTENISGYFKFATLTVSASYINRGIQISYVSRGRTGGIIYCIFANTTSTDPSLTVTKTGSADVYYIKTATSTWDLYMSKTENYDQQIFSIINTGQLTNNGLDLEWQSISATELPEGYQTAAVHTIALNISGNATTAARAGTAGYAITAARATTSGYAITANYSKTATTAGYATTASMADTAWYALYASTANIATSAFHASTAGFAKKADSANFATVASKLGTADVGNEYKPIYLVAGVATANYSFIPSTGGTFTGAVHFNGPVYLNDETQADSLTTGSLLVNGQANFVQSPTAPTPIDSSNDTTVATTEFVKKAFNANDAMVFKGVLNASSEIPTSGYSTGWTYRIGTAGSYAGEACEIGDLLIAINDGPASGDSLIALDWIRIEHNIDGALFKGTNAFTNNHVLIADSTNGKVKDSGYTIAANVDAGQTKYLAIYTNGTTIGKTLNAHINTTSENGSIKGYEELVLGDASTRFGRLALYGSTAASGGAYIVASNPTSWTTHVLPNTAGWLVTAGNGSNTGAGAQNLPVYIATTGVATAVNAQNTANNLLDNLSASSSDPADGDTYIASYADGKNVDHNGTNTYHRRPISNLYNYIKTKLAVTNNNINLSWNTETTIATIGGTAIKVKIPDNPNTNTDTLVKQTAKTDNVEYKLLATASASPTSGSAAEATYNVDVTINPSKKAITAYTYNVTSAASITYNTSTGCLEIIT